MSSLYEFNETDFPEYDPTPYDGGYDINTTYGKPLPPSEKICYPRAGEPQKSSSPPPAQALIDEIEKPSQQIESKPPFADNNISEKTDFVPPIELNLGKESPQFEENGYSDSLSEGIGEYDYEGEENGYTLGQVPLPPSEYVEPCASLFGYWPCLMKDYYKKNALQQCCIDKGYGNGWRKAEDYFFGSSYPYGETRDDYINRVDYNYGYEKHYMEQPTYVQESYNQHSQKMNSHVDVHYGYEKHYMEQPTQGYYNPESQQLSTHVDVNYGYNKHHMEHPIHVQEHYNPDSQNLSTHVDISYGYEKHYTEQPAYVQEEYHSQKLSTYVDINYGYEKHYKEQPSIVPEEYSSQLSKQVEDNYVYDQRYKEQSSYVQENLWPEKMSNQVEVEQNYGYDEPYSRHHVKEDYGPDLESQNMYRQLNIFQGYDKRDVEQTTHVYEDCDLQFHPQKLSSQEDFNYGCERSYKEQPSYVQDDHKPQLWSQMLSYSYYEA